MAKHSSSILELARRGAQHRYEELQQELASLGPGGSPICGAVHAGSCRAGGGLCRRPPRNSASEASQVERRGSGEDLAAQRRRWAKQKAATPPRGGGQPKSRKEAITRYRGIAGIIVPAIASPVESLIHI